MARYLIECDCGNQVPVDVGQAGGQIACSCGAKLDVPQLRKLRHLPTVAEPVERASSTWSARQGVMTISLILVVVFVALSIWNWHTQPSVPVFKPVEHNQNVEDVLKKITPAESWDLWLNYRMLAERGMMIFEPGNRTQIESEIAHHQSTRRTLWVLAGIAAAIAATASFWPHARPHV